MRQLQLRWVALLSVLYSFQAHAQAVQPARATAAAPSWIEGQSVQLSVDRSGVLRTNATITGSVSVSGISGTLSNNTSAPGANNIGSLPAIANAAAPTYTEGRQVLTSVDLAGSQRVNVTNTPAVTVSGTPTVTVSGTATVAGNLTTNGAAPAATNAGVLPAIANAAAPTYTEGRQVLQSVDLAGSQRVNVTNTPTVTVSGTPNVAVTNTPSVTVTKVATTQITSGYTSATALTQLIAAPGASTFICVTSVSASASVASTTTTDQQPNFYYGTGSNCGTGTTLFYGNFNIANSGYVHPFDPPAKVATANNALCYIDAAAGTKIFNVSYYTAVGGCTQ